MVIPGETTVLAQRRRAIFQVVGPDKGSVFPGRAFPPIPMKNKPGAVDGAEESLDGLLDEMDDVLGDFLDQAAASPVPDPGGSTPPLDGGQWGFNEMEETFLAILRSSLKPVTRYIKALGSIRHNPSLYEIINLTVHPMAELARKAELQELAAILGDLSESCLEASAANGERSRRAGLKNDVLERYQALSERVDIAFRGHRPAVLNLLRFYQRVRLEGFQADDIQRFFAVGIPSVSWVSRTPASEIVSLSGVSDQGIRRLKTLSRQSGRKIGFKNAGLDLSRLSRLSTKL